MNKFLSAARKRIVLVVAIFIGFFLLIQGAKVLSPRHGLQGKYYANDSWDGPPVFMTVDPSISFDKKTMAMRTGNVDRLSAIWEGYIFVPKSSTYRFSVNSDDGSWVYVDDVPLIDNGGIHPAKKRARKFSCCEGAIVSASNILTLAMKERSFSGGRKRIRFLSSWPRFIYIQNR